MDRRIFLALGVLAAAAGSPAFAEQVRAAREQGGMLHIDRGALVDAIYRVALSRNGAAVGTRALTHLGHNRGEAAQMTRLAIGIARKSGSPESFRMIVDGRLPAGVRLDDRESALLRSVRAGGGSGGPGRTWEGSAMTAAPRPGQGARPTIWDGRTWEGSEV